MFYFTRFPNVAYVPPIPKASGSGSAKSSTTVFVATDITKRVLIKQLAGESALIYYDYIVEDGERPDIIAEKLYGDSTVDWLIFLFNGIVDPHFQWVMSIRNFENYLRQKYGSIATAQATHIRYEKLIHGTSNYINDFGETISIPAKYITVDKSTYDALSASSRREIDAYTHEDNLNEAKRKIKLLEPAFVNDLLDNYRQLFR